jgi:hypothetical protein
MIEGGPGRATWYGDHLYAFMLDGRESLGLAGRVGVAYDHPTDGRIGVDRRYLVLALVHRARDQAPDIFTGSQLPAEGRRHIERTHDDLWIDARFNLAGRRTSSSSLRPSPWTSSP